MATRRRTGRRVGFVTPRYGPGVVGGSEHVMAEAARGLLAHGYETEIITTCAKDHYTWANDFPAGDSDDGGLTIRRFPTEAGRHDRRMSSLQERIVRGQSLTTEEELAWLNGRFRVPQMYRWLARHGGDLDAIVFSPYLFWTTVYGASVHPDRSIVLPCLHDEQEARFYCVSQMLSDVASVWFLSEPEHQLGHRVANLPPHHAVVGAAVEEPAVRDPERFRRRHGLERPFIYYAGRREDGKGWRALVKAFGAAVLRHDLPFDLVTAGVGVPWIPDVVAERVIDLGYLEPDDLSDGFAAAAAYCQPSRNESFSRTIMQAWLAGTPVLASTGSDVVTWHCERSGGGLSYADEWEFAECLRFLADAPEAAAELGSRGRRYVLANYTWPIVTRTMADSLEALWAR